MRKTLLIDVDNVLRDIITPMCTIYNAEFGTKLTPADVKHWDLAETFKEVEEAYVKEYFFQDRAHAMQIFEHAPLQEELIPYMIQGLHKRHDIHLVTDQLPQNIPFTLTWLYAHNIPFKGIHFTKDKSKVLGDILLDDGVHNLEAVAKNGTIPIVRTQPWNKFYDGGRVNAFNEFVYLLNNLYGK